MENNEKKEFIEVKLIIKKRAYMDKYNERKQALDYSYHCPVRNRDVKLMPVFKSDGYVNIELLGVLLQDDTKPVTPTTAR